MFWLCGICSLTVIWFRCLYLYIERFVLSEWIDEWRARLPWFEGTSMLIEKNMMLYNHWIITLVF